MLAAEDYLSGQVLLIDKPLHWTSFQVVNKLRYELKKAFKLKNIKVGHAGTLDPLATGLLVICTGKMTKQIDSFQGQIKEYTGTLILGSTTPSYDLETAIDKTFQTHHITTQLIQETTSQFIGDIQQIPPIFSALKQDGKRLYLFARAGEEVNIKSRQVTIQAFEITNIDTFNIDFRIVCSKGTYIRSLVHDFGKALNSGAHLSALRRTGIGDFNVNTAKSVEDFLKSLPSE
ncbi:tRNA pseudouridine(55) synthase TruB [Yeosuana sp. AK3]